MATETALAKAEPSEIAASPQYQQLLADCREICESGRQAIVLHYWALGQAISNAAPRDERSQWGAKVIEQLERDLAIDRTTLIRSVQLFETFDQASLGAHGHLSWGKLRLLLPIPEDMRRQILARLESGELRTVDAVRSAINLLKQNAGLLPASPLGEAQPDLFGIKGLHAGTIEKIWRRADPISRGLTLRLLIPHLGLEKVDRKDAVSTMRAIRQQLEAYESQLGEGE